MPSTNLLLLCILFCSHLIVAFALTCVKENSCRCKTPDGRVFDLTPLASTDPNHPKYSVDVSTGGTTETLYYNPCNAIKCDPSSPATAAVCDKYSGAYFNGGDQSSAKFSIDSSNNVQIQYSSAAASSSSTLKFVCSETQEHFTMSVSGLDYSGTLTSKHACFTSPTPPPSDASSGLSLGDVLLIILFCSLAIYFIIGILFQAFVRKERGLDLVPNRAFWTGLPGNVVDGGRFAVSKVKSVTTKGEYEKM